MIAQIRRELDDYRSFPGICGQCVHAKTCLTGCVANNYADSGALIAPQPLCAEAVRRGVFPESRRRRDGDR
jgi:radical SAM protein with 4Fe4S-binding SPASM domain